MYNDKQLPLREVKAVCENIAYYHGSLFFVCERGKNDGNIIVNNQKSKHKLTKADMWWIVDCVEKVYNHGVEYIFLCPKRKYRWIKKICDKIEPLQALEDEEGIVIKLNIRLIQGVKAWVENH